MRGRLLLVLFGLTVGLLLAEGAARVRERFRCQSYCALYCDLNSFCGWWHASDVRGWCQLCIGGRVEWRTYGRYNRRGLRDDRDIPTSRTAASASSSSATPSPRPTRSTPPSPRSSNGGSTPPPAAVAASRC